MSKSRYRCCCVGPPGFQGPPGEDGTPGQPGQNGPPGPAGTGAFFATVGDPNISGDLTEFAFPDGTLADTGLSAKDLWLIPDVFFGSGKDGVYTGIPNLLQGDINATSISLSTGTNVNTNGYRVYCQGLCFIASGASFFCNGGPGGAGTSSGVGAAGGSAFPPSNQGALFSTAQGAVGGNQVGGNGGNAGIITTGGYWGGVGGPGGTASGGTINGTGGPGYNPTTPASTARARLNSLAFLATAPGSLNSTLTFVAGPAGGGGGVQVTASPAAGFGGGGGGGPGGIVWLAAKQLDIQGQLIATGGDGGAGAGTSSASSAGGGGAGGGAVIVIYRTGSNPTAQCVVNGGAGGVGPAPGTNGTPGGTGYVFIKQI